MTPEQKAFYMDKSGLCCPYCESVNISAEPPEMDGMQGWQNVRCYDCSEDWVDVLRLVDVE